MHTELQRSNIRLFPEWVIFQGGKRVLGQQLLTGKGGWGVLWRGTHRAGKKTVEKLGVAYLRSP